MLSSLSEIAIASFSSSARLASNALPSFCLAALAFRHLDASFAPCDGVDDEAGEIEAAGKVGEAERAGVEDVAKEVAEEDVEEAAESCEAANLRLAAYTPS